MRFGIHHLNPSTVAKLAFCPVFQEHTHSCSTRNTTMTCILLSNQMLEERNGSGPEVCP